MLPTRAYEMSSTSSPLAEQVDFVRMDVSRRLDPTKRSQLGQFLTPAPVARFMASMFEPFGQSVRLLDAGAGVGSLSAAFVDQVIGGKTNVDRLTVTAYEVDPALAEYLEETLDACRVKCTKAGIRFSGDVRCEDFIEAGVAMLGGDLFRQHSEERYDCAILNPPYRKIRRLSKEDRLLRRIGAPASNLYVAFMSLAARLLEPRGQLVAITPRSFCNGPYFAPFRKWFLESMTLRRIHVFDDRGRAFGDDGVLQENVILSAAKGGQTREEVIVSSSNSPEDDDMVLRAADYSEVVHPTDVHRFIRIVADDLGTAIANQMARFGSTLEELGMAVSTGPVVDFRAKEFLRKDAADGTVPLIYPRHLSHGSVQWPGAGTSKPNALVVTRATKPLLVPSQTYVLVKRFSAKEEQRRVVAAVYDPRRMPCDEVAFENHLNYYHEAGGGLSRSLAKGLAAFLNSSLVDAYFRQFSGHTQVNATDLRSLAYPSREQLETLGSRIGKAFPEQIELDRLIEEELSPMVTDADSVDPIRAQEKIDQAVAALRALGLPREQLNERSALTLLSLLDLRPETEWRNASSPLRGITEMMDYFAQHFGKRYAPNTRETVRRYTVHQFMQAALVTQNPDDSSRPTNSPKNVHQIEELALNILRTFGTDAWPGNVKAHLTSVETLRNRYAREREMARVPIQLAPGQTITLSPGGQNVLVEQIISEFCPRFTPAGSLIYVGDTADKWAFFDRDALGALGIVVEEHGKMPDVIVYRSDKHWLVLIEAVTSHGPIGPKRHAELEDLFGRSTAGLVFVTTFLDRRTLVRHLGDIAWETEVWIAEAPTHMIHFNGERFLGPHGE